MFPFGNFESYFDLLEKISDGEPPSAEGLSPEGKSFVETCLQKDPSQRLRATEVMSHGSRRGKSYRTILPIFFLSFFLKSFTEAHQTSIFASCR